MVASFLKLSRQNILDAVNFHGYVPRRQACDFSDGCSVHLFEVEDDDLPVEGFESLNQGFQALQITVVVYENLGLSRVRKSLEIVQIHEA